jgi:hypothetical protein
MIGNGVTSIGVWTFAHCGSLTTVTIPANVTSIADYAFYDCYNLIGVTIPDSVTSIGNGAFAYCYLASVTIPASVTNVGSGAFEACSGLTSVIIPASVTSIGGDAFHYCSSLTVITVDPASSFYSSVDGVLFDKNQTTLIQFPTGRRGGYTIPKSVTGIGDGAFWYCHLASLTIGSGLTSIGDGAFAYCRGLTSVTIPASVTSIGDQTFYDCLSLRAAYFLGNAPPDPGDAFDNDYGIPSRVIIYYFPGAMGWSPFFSGAPTELWNPQASALGITGGHFGFDITGPSNTVIVVEACTNLSHPVWLPVSTNALNGSASSFSDSQSANYPARFYRFRSP